MQHSHCYDLAAFLIGKQELSYEALPGLDARGSKLEGTWILLNGRQDQLFYILERSISPLQVQTIYLEEWQDQLGVASILFGGMRELLDANQGRSVDGTSSLYSWPSLHQRFISERKAASFLQHHRNIPGRNVLLCQAKLLQGPLLHLQGGCALHSNDTTGLGTRESEGDLQDHNSARSCEASKLQQCSCLIRLDYHQGSLHASTKLLSAANSARHGLNSSFVTYHGWSRTRMAPEGDCKAARLICLSLCSSSAANRIARPSSATAWRKKSLSLFSSSAAY
mmetsp:Transcript_15006/g.35338  ORF Transcript_15006/g.35338 Transcript_15006/m.35338 type:complete len:281 (-) Transcript_15006:715-1557(-)